jgi:putative copper export protein
MLTAAAVLLRAALLLLTLQVAGVALFGAVFGARLQGSRPHLVYWGRRLTVLAFVLLLVTLALEPVRLAGDFDGMTDPTLYAMVLQSTLGPVFALRLCALVLSAVALARLARGAIGRPIALAAALLTVASFTLTGHSATASPRVVAIALLAVHLTIICFWLGALLPLWLAARHESAAVANRIVERFSQLATFSVPVIGLAGIALAAVLLPDWAALQQPYGRLLLVKLGLFVLLLGCAALNKWRLGPALAEGRRQGASHFRRVVTLEYLLICAVLLATAIMTTFFSPVPA